MRLPLVAWILRRRGQNPAEILAPHVREGMTVLEPGSGMESFTLDLARLVGISGRLVAVNVQPKMLDRLKRHAAEAGLLNRRRPYRFACLNGHQQLAPINRFHPCVRRGT